MSNQLEVMAAAGWHMSSVCQSINVTQSTRYKELYGTLVSAAPNAAGYDALAWQHCWLDTGNVHLLYRLHNPGRVSKAR